MIMYNCEYTNSTNYTFSNPLCDNFENINYVGAADENTLEKALTCSPISNKWVQMFETKIFDIPVQKPSMEGIVTVNTCVQIISNRVIKTPVVTGYTNSADVLVPGTEISNAECTFLTGRKLIVEGIITQKIIYTSLAEDQALHSANFMIPFSTFIIVDADTPLSAEFRIYPYVEDVFVYMLSERTIFSNNTLFIKVAPVC